MESRPDTSAMGREDYLSIIPVDQEELGQNSDDVLARRLKNRERQRRYRERKRLEADKKKPETANTQVNPALNCGEIRILCRRKWKQDARRAHVAKQQQILANGSCDESRARLFEGVDGPIIQFENNFGNSVSEDVIERRVVHGRRQWKADARNKKD